MKKEINNLVITCPTCNGNEMIDHNPNHDRCPDCNGSFKVEVAGFYISIFRDISGLNKPSKNENQDEKIDYYVSLEHFTVPLDLDYRLLEHHAIVHAYNDYLDNFSEYLVNNIKISPKYK